MANSHESNLAVSTWATIPYIVLKIKILELLLHLPGANELK